MHRLFQRQFTAQHRNDALFRHVREILVQCAAADIALDQQHAFAQPQKVLRKGK